MSETIHLTVQDLTENATLNAEQVRVIEAVSPEMTVERVEGGVKVTTKDWKQETEAVVHDGAKGNKGDPGDPGQDGVSPTASVTQTAAGATVTVTDASGTTTANLTNGQDGYSPTASVSKSGDTATITITDKTGTTTAQVEDGQPGQDGISPTVTITEITGGHRITITDATGSHSADVMDGEGGVTDVQVNGASVVQGGVANVPKAESGGLGVVKVSSTGSDGISVDSDGKLAANRANTTEIKVGSAATRMLTPQLQQYAAFYGLSKAAGSDEKNSTLPVGQYTEAAKSAISTMLSGSVSVSGATPAITALPGIQYVCGEVSTLDITLPASGCIDVTFVSGSTPTVLTVTPPTGVTVKWAGGFDPTALEANTTYEVNIADGLGVAGSWT